MRLYEILTESTTNLKEGPKVDAVASGVGKVAGTAVRGVKSLATGTASAWQALKKGFKAGKDGKVSVGNTPSTAAKRTGTAATSAPATSGSEPVAPATSATPGTAAKRTGTAATSAISANQRTAPTDIATDSPGKINMKTIKSSVAKLPKNQRMQLRKLIAVKAGA
jgi:hypothetical protein